MGTNSVRGAPSIRSSRSAVSQRAVSVRSSILDRSGSYSDEKSESESDSDSDTDDSDDSESVFLYSRVQRLPASFFWRDQVSACCFTAEVHVYATHSGIVHLCRPDATPIRTVRVHRASVLDIACDGSYVATASIDGTVVVVAVEDPSDIVQASFRRPVHAVALHPDYATHRSYVTGGTAGQVTVSERGWLRARSDRVLAQTQSTILAVSWVGTRLLWANEDGISVYDTASDTILDVVTRPPNSPRADLFRPRITIEGNEAIVAWAYNVFIIDVTSGHVLQQFDLTFPTSGAVPFQRTQLAVLAVVELPALKLLDRQTGLETYEDELELQSGKTKLGPNDYHLGQSENLFIVSSTDAVVARARTARDHVDWLVEHQRYAEAYVAAKQPAANLTESEIKDIGLQAADSLSSQGKWEQAAYVLSETIDPEDRAQWLLWANRFFGAHQHLILGDIIPPVALEDVHDGVLEAAVNEADTDRLQQWIESWDLEIFDGQKLAAQLRQAANTKPELLSCLASLYLKLGEHISAVQSLVAVNSSKAFDVVKKFHLWTEPEVMESLSLILTAGDGDGEGGYVGRIRELINVRAELPPGRVVAQLAAQNDQDLLLFGYLTELGQVDETWLGKFADLLIKLYAKYDRGKLLGFLVRYDTYDIAQTIEVCREQHFDNELVYLLGQIGQTSEALDIIVNQLHDYHRAVEFARNHGPEVWSELITYSTKHPELVLELLKCVEVSPARVLSTVPASMRIPGLKQALCSVLNDQEVSLALSQGALAIVRSESEGWSRLLRASRLEGLLVEPTEDETWAEPVLINDDNRVTVEKMPGAVTFSDKIRHLRAILTKFSN